MEPKEQLEELLKKAPSLCQSLVGADASLKSLSVSLHAAAIRADMAGDKQAAAFFTGRKMEVDHISNAINIEQMTKWVLLPQHRNYF